MSSYITTLEDRVRELEAEKVELLNAINELKTYLTSDKFYPATSPGSSDPLYGKVNCQDVLNRLPAVYVNYEFHNGYLDGISGPFNAVRYAESKMYREGVRAGQEKRDKNDD